jgi:hypothetical protein
MKTPPRLSCRFFYRRSPLNPHFHFSATIFHALHPCKPMACASFRTEAEPQPSAASLRSALSPKDDDPIVGRRFQLLHQLHIRGQELAGTGRYMPKSSRPSFACHMVSSRRFSSGEVFSVPVGSKPVPVSCSADNSSQTPPRSGWLVSRAASKAVAQGFVVALKRAPVLWL